MTDDERDELLVLLDEIGGLLPWRHATREQSELGRTALLTLAEILRGGSIAEKLDELRTIRDKLEAQWWSRHERG